ncbi:S-layer homology domain-containing protein [Paenibacillus sp. JDR-2]|uniref:S-layer homology domain-containing protein n=1 Tax=Paenibacillus sp. (strain JDR-2) TaxID=324057 RepID=UPI00223EE612|nr:S-layer homology domain-containing protein [Paenibacillus sp. JDR-2]
MFRMLLAMVIALGLTSAPRAEANAPALPAVTAAPSVQGELVNVTIKGSGVGHLYGVQLQIAYDATALEFVSAKPRYFEYASQRQVNTDAYDLLDTAGAPVGFQLVTAEDGNIDYLASQVKQGATVSDNSAVLDLQFKALHAGTATVSVVKSKLMKLLQDKPEEITGATLSLSLGGSETEHSGSGSIITSSTPASDFVAAITSIVKNGSLSKEQKIEQVKAYIGAHLPALAVYQVPANNISGGGSAPVLASVNGQALQGAVNTYADLLKQLKLLAATAGINDPWPSVFHIQLPPTVQAESVQVELPAGALITMKQAGLALLIDTSTGSMSVKTDAFLLPANATVFTFTFNKLAGAAGTGISVALQADAKQSGTVPLPGPVQLSFPYTLKPGEKGDRVIIVQLKEDGSEVPVVNSWYDAVSGQMVFRTLEAGSFIIKSASSSFSDMQDHWSKNAVEQLADRGVLKGKAGNRFDPQGDVTREEFAAMLVRAFALTAGSGAAGHPFKDVDEGSWSADAIQIAYSLGIVNGTSPTSFHPQQLITREELAVMLYKAAQAAQLLLPSANAPKVSDLSQASAFATESLNQLLQSGIMQGDGKGAVHPRTSATRAESAMMIYKAIKLFREGANWLQ